MKKSGIKVIKKPKKAGYKKPKGKK